MLTHIATILGMKSLIVGDVGYTTENIYMSISEDILCVLKEFSQSSMLENAITRCLHLVCRITGCPAAAIVTTTATVNRRNHWLEHDPGHLFAQRDADNSRGGGNPDSSSFCVGGDSDAPKTLREVSIPLHCAGRVVGCLNLLAANDAGDASITSQVPDVLALLTLLLLALDYSVADCRGNVLSYEGFRDELASEISRSERSNASFSVVHIQLAWSSCFEEQERSCQWTTLIALARSLISSLRVVDHVAVMGHDRLAVLLPGTSRSGARIASRRIELLLPLFLKETFPRGAAGYGTPVCDIRFYPDDGRNVAELCRLADAATAAKVGMSEGGGL